MRTILHGSRTHCSFFETRSICPVSCLSERGQRCSQREEYSPPLPDAVRRALDQQKQTFQNLLRAKDEIISRYEAQLDSVSKRAELEKAELQKLDQDRANQLDFLENQANRLEDEATKTRSAASAAMASQQEKERASQQATDHLQAECVRLRGEIERVVILENERTELQSQLRASQAQHAASQEQLAEHEEAMEEAVKTLPAKEEALERFRREREAINELLQIRFEAEKVCRSDEVEAYCRGVIREAVDQDYSGTTKRDDWQPRRFIRFPYVVRGFRALLREFSAALGSGAHTGHRAHTEEVLEFTAALEFMPLDFKEYKNVFLFLSQGICGHKRYLGPGRWWGYQPLWFVLPLPHDR